MDSNRFRGMGVALVTPFMSNGEIDYDQLAAIIEHVITGKADFIVVMGTTGETPTLSAAERVVVKRFVVEKNNGRVPLMLGLGGNCTHDVCTDLQTTDLEGYDAILSVAPFYNKPSQKGLFLHFKAISEASPLPVMLYNIPGRTGVNIFPDTVLSIASDCPNVFGIKEASGNIKQIEDIMVSRPSGFLVMSGDDALAYPIAALGGDGVISVAGNAFPEQFAEMIHNALNGEFPKARIIHEVFEPLYESLFTDGNPSGIKYVLSRLGLCKDVLRLPLVPVTATTASALDRAMASVMNPLHVQGND